MKHRLAMAWFLINWVVYLCMQASLVWDIFHELSMRTCLLAALYLSFYSAQKFFEAWNDEEENTSLMME